MKTYTATLYNLRGKDVLDLIDSMPKHVQWDINLDAEPEPEKKKTNGHAKDADALTMTGKKARPRSSRGQVLTMFEKLEVKHGIGNVTRKMLREETTKKGIDSQIIYQLLRDDYLRKLT